MYYTIKRYVKDGMILPANSVLKGVEWHIPIKFTYGEAKVIGLLCKGESNKEIAYQLNTKYSSVKKHINSILIKLSVTNRTKAALLLNGVVL